MSGLRSVGGLENEVAGLLFGRVSDEGISPDASASEEWRREWLESWLVDWRFGVWEHCLYCGREAGVSDHVIPHAFYSVEKRGGHRGAAWGLRTPACPQCNTLVGALLFETLFERCRWLNGRLRSRYRRVLRLPKWESDELGELGYSLRSYVKGKQTERAVAMERVAWFESAEQRQIVQGAVNEAVSIFPGNQSLVAFLGNGFL